MTISEAMVCTMLIHVSPTFDLSKKMIEREVHRAHGALEFLEFSQYKSIMIFAVVHSLEN